jgi:hypothetical protein
MNAFNEFNKMFMVVGMAVHSTHAVGLAVRFADQPAIMKGPNWPSARIDQQADWQSTYHGIRGGNRPSF